MVEPTRCTGVETVTSHKTSALDTRDITQACDAKNVPQT
jgi:hypothetical protein